jgi:hypothetical protein
MEMEKESLKKKKKWRKRIRGAMPLAFVSPRVGVVGPTAQWTAADNPPATATGTPTAAAD